MTINITVLTRSAIFVSGDYRLFDEARKTPEPEPSAKAVVIADPGWTGFVTYTGIGRVGRKHTSELLREWLDDIDTESFDETVEAIRSKSTNWIHSVRPGHPHTFVIAAFPNDVATVAIVSNFERWHGKQTGKVAQDFFTTRITCTRGPTAIVTGRSNAIPRDERRALERRAKRLSHDTARMRRVLADANRAAAQVDPDRISPECFVHSQLKDGTGHDEAFGSVPGAFPVALPEAQRKAVKALLDDAYGAGEWSVRGATFASFPSGPAIPRNECSLEHRRGDCDEYKLISLQSAPGGRARPADVNSLRIAVGQHVTSPGRTYPCYWRPDGTLVALPHLGGLAGQAFAINSLGQAVGYSEDRWRRSTACTWTIGPDDPLTDIGSRFAPRSSAHAINDVGQIAGWVSDSESDGAQHHYRPAIWRRDDTVAKLSGIGEGVWGEVIQITETGMALGFTVKGMRQSDAFLWSGEDGSYGISAPGSGALQGKSFIPKRLIGADLVVGTLVLGSGSRRIASVTPQGWTLIERLGEGYELSAADGAGNLVGYGPSGGYEVPWVYSAAEDVVKILPHYEHHNCRPTSISDGGLITGSAASDRCEHPLIWQLLKS